MSFANFDLEAQKAVSTDTTENSELDSIIHKTSQQLQLFANSISRLEFQRKQLGTRRDDLELRSGLDNLVSSISTMELAILKLLKQLSLLINSSSMSNQLIIKDRLNKEFDQLTEQFEKSKRLYKEKVIKTKVSNHLIYEAPSESTPLIQQQLQVQQEDEISQTDLQYHLLLTEERNREIEQVSQGITEINTIFKDLGSLINQQGESLDTIEDNILQLHGNTQQADRELQKADQYQKSKGKWSCILLSALSIVVLVIVLAVVS